MLKANLDSLYDASEHGPREWVLRHEDGRYYAGIVPPDYFTHTFTRDPKKAKVMNENASLFARSSLSSRIGSVREEFERVHISEIAELNGNES